MGRLALIDGLAAAVFLISWYLVFTRYNQRKGANALRWVEAACSGKARVVDAHWTGVSLLVAHLRFAAHWFENAQVTVRLSPRPLPPRWLVSLWRKQKETLTFEADLDYKPGFQLELFRHRWVTQKRAGGFRPTSKNWMITRPGPVVLTTRSEWAQELTPVVNTLMTSRGHDLISVRFRQESPHLQATIDLDSLSDEQSAAMFLDVLRDLAAGASTRQ